MPDGSAHKSPAPIEAFRFAAAATLAKSGKDGRRKFSGIAYSGDVIADHWYWGNLVMDCASTKAADSLPILLDHKTDKITGTGSMTFGNSMNVDGELSAVTEHGKSVAALADEGFPWQMSVNVDPGTIEEVARNVKVKCNGREFTGPLTIFRQNTIREVSFCAVGADAQTSAEVFNRTHEGANPTMTTAASNAAPTIESLTAQLALSVASVATLTAERDALRVETTIFRKDRLAQVFKARNVEITDEIAKPYLAMSAEGFVAALALAGPAKAATTTATTTTTAPNNPALFNADNPAPEGGEAAGGAKKRTGLVKRAEDMGKKHSAANA